MTMSVPEDKLESKVVTGAAMKNGMLQTTGVALSP